MLKLNFTRFFLIIFYVFIPVYTFADDICSKYKFDVDVSVKNTEHLVKAFNELGKLAYVTKLERVIR